MLGLTGSNAAGKGEVAAYLRRLDFAVASLSDVVREEARARGLPPEREHLIRIGNLLREQGGPGALAQRILPRLGDRDVVDSIRNPAEVTVLRHLNYFRLVGVRAPLQVRFARSRERARPGDPTTLAQFRQREEQENSTDPAAQQLTETFRLADRIIDNDAGLPALHSRIDRLLEELERAAASADTSGPPIG